MDGPLTGIRVTGLTTVISGPVRTMILADQGGSMKVKTTACFPHHGQGPLRFVT